MLHSHEWAFPKLLLSIFDRCQGKWIFCLWFTSFVSLRKYSVNLSNPAYSVAKQRQHLWRTITLLISTTNGNKSIVKRHTVLSYFFVLESSRVISGIMYRMLVMIMNKLLTVIFPLMTGVLYIIPYIYIYIIWLKKGDMPRSKVSSLFTSGLNLCLCSSS